MKTNLIKTITVKTMVILACTLMIGLTGNIALYPANAASWQTDGWAKDNGQWIYYRNSQKVTGWLKDGNDWYYLDSNGIMQTGSQTINGITYNLLTNGTWDGYSVSSNSATTNKSTDNNTVKAIDTNTTKSVDNSNTVQSQPVVNETLFATQTTDGWLKTSDGWEYLNNLKKATGWQHINGIWYYFNSNGIMATNTTIEGKYKVGSNGALCEEDRNSDSSTTSTSSDNSTGTISYDEFTKIADTTMLNLVNAHRQANGVSALSWDSILAAMATEKSNHMIKHNYFSHEYEGRGTMLVQEVAWKHSVNAENILANYSYPISAKGAKDMATAMFNQWKASAGHNQQMLNVSHTRMGFGFAFANGKAQYESYAAQQFANADDIQYEDCYTGKSLDKYKGGLN